MIPEPKYGTSLEASRSFLPDMTLALSIVWYYTRRYTVLRLENIEFSKYNFWLISFTSSGSFLCTLYFQTKKKPEHFLFAYNIFKTVHKLVAIAFSAVQTENFSLINFILNKCIQS